jgi:hypothetical protein
MVRKVLTPWIAVWLAVMVLLFVKIHFSKYFSTILYSAIVSLLHLILKMDNAGVWESKEVGPPNLD